MSHISVQINIIRGIKFFRGRLSQQLATAERRLNLHPTPTKKEGSGLSIYSGTKPPTGMLLKGAMMILLDISDFEE